MSHGFKITLWLSIIPVSTESWAGLKTEAAWMEMEIDVKKWISHSLSPLFTSLDLILIHYEQSKEPENYESTARYILISINVDEL